MSDPARVLTDIPGKPGGFWGDHTRCVDAGALGRRWQRSGRIGRWLVGTLIGLQLFARQRGYAGLVTGGETASSVLAFLQTVFPWGRRPHVMIAQLYVPSSKTAYAWKRRQLGFISRSLAAMAVWAHHEIEDYHRAYGISREKIAYVPFHHTLEGYRFEIADEGYLFSGGNYDRDYPNLVEAVRDLDVPVWIATTRPELLTGVSRPDRIKVEGTTNEGFRRAIAGSRAVVVAMAGGLLHSGGQQTLLNAMVMGKPVIAVGRDWAADLIEDRVHGLAVDYEDPAALREAVRWIWENPAEAARMAERGREHAQGFTTRRTMEALYRLAGGSERD